MNTAPPINPVEWVTNHLEARGQLLVRGGTLVEIVNQALTAAHDYVPGQHQAAARIRVLCPRWWTVGPCECHRRFASSNHPTWHYRAVNPAVSEAWYGAEVRILLSASRHRAA